MSYWLRMPEHVYETQFMWAMALISYIYYAYNLAGVTSGQVRQPEFARQLQPEHREIHYDLVGHYPHKSGISSYRKHQYHALRRREILEGKFIPQSYPTSYFPASLAEYPEWTGLN